MRKLLVAIIVLLSVFGSFRCSEELQDTFEGQDDLPDDPNELANFLAGESLGNEDPLEGNVPQDKKVLKSITMHPIPTDSTSKIIDEINSFLGGPVKPDEDCDSILKKLTTSHLSPHVPRSSFEHTLNMWKANCMAKKVDKHLPKKERADNYRWDTDEMPPLPKSDSKKHRKIAGAFKNLNIKNLGKEVIKKLVKKGAMIINKNSKRPKLLIWKKGKAFVQNVAKNVARRIRNFELIKKIKEKWAKRKKTLLKRNTYKCKIIRKYIKKHSKSKTALRYKLDKRYHRKCGSKKKMMSHHVHVKWFHAVVKTHFLKMNSKIGKTIRRKAAKFYADFKAALKRHGMAGFGKAQIMFQKVKAKFVELYKKHKRSPSKEWMKMQMKKALEKARKMWKAIKKYGKNVYAGAKDKYKRAKEYIAKNREKIRRGWGADIVPKSRRRNRVSAPPSNNSGSALVSSNVNELKKRCRDIEEWMDKRLPKETNPFTHHARQCYESHCKRVQDNPEIERSLRIMRKRTIKSAFNRYENGRPRWKFNC